VEVEVEEESQHPHPEEEVEVEVEAEEVLLEDHHPQMEDLKETSHLNSWEIESEAKPSC